MRAWRKIHASILDSDSLILLSSDAIVLFVFLVVAQDDTGYYPWQAAKVQRLIATRPKWNLAKAQQYAEELVQSGVARWEDGGIILVNGERLNGHLRESRPREEYHRVATRSQPNNHVTDDDEPVDNQWATSGLPVVALEKRRVEKSREEKNKSRVEKNTAAASEESLVQYLLVLAQAHAAVDCGAEFEKCRMWYEEHRKKPPGKLAFRNWVEKAERIQQEQGRNGKHRSDPQEDIDAGNQRFYDRAARGYDD